MLSLRRRDIVCQQAVELVTDYLEGALSRRSGAASNATCAPAPTAPPTSSRSGSPIALSGGRWSPTS